jgi:hypothetical protein
VPKRFATSRQHFESQAKSAEEVLTRILNS